MKRPIKVVAFFVAFVSAVLGAQENTKPSATTTLRHYIELRLRWADWKEYSPLITWPDEPGWDCWWVAKGYRVDRATTRGSKTVIPVTYTRLGLLCANPEFEPKPKVETIPYELVRSDESWKVVGPVPDYPYVGLETAREWLRKAIADPAQTNDRRQQARKSLELLAE
jgi:hypothetical protein